MAPPDKFGIEVNFLTGRYVATFYNDRRATGVAAATRHGCSRPSWRLGRRTAVTRTNGPCWNGSKRWRRPPSPHPMLRLARWSPISCR